MSPTTWSPEDLARRHFTAMETGDPALAAAVIHPRHVNHEAIAEPPSAKQLGVPGFLATSAWLRLAFADLRFTIDRLVHQDDLTVARVVMSGRQTGPFVVFPEQQKPVSFPPTRAEFAVRQCHLFTVRDGLHAEHAAVRDDLGLMTQLGHLPPSPAAGLRLARWRAGGGHRRSVRLAIECAAQAAETASQSAAIER